MFSAFKKFFGKSGAGVMEPPSAARPTAPAFASRANAARPVRTESPARPVVVPGNAPAFLKIPLKSIISRLPDDLRRRMRQDVGETELTIATQKVLSQIGQGAVKITFGELRQVSPPGAFGPETDKDRALVEIPLHEILARLDASFLPRRSPQKQVTVPPEITGPFGNQTKVTFTTAPLKPVAPAAPEPAAPAPLEEPPLQFTPPRPAPQSRPTAAPFQPAQPLQPFQPAIALAQAPAPVRPVAPARTPVVPFQPAALAPLAKAPPAAAPAKPKFELEDIPFKRVGQASPSPVSIQPIASVDAEVAVAPITPIAPEPEPEPAPIRFSPPAPAPIAMPSIAGETRFLTVPIADLAGGWPDGVQQEIGANQLMTSSLALPFGVIEIAIKQGKVALPWRILRSWIKPPVALPASPNDALTLELPLKVLTPIFLAELRSGKPQKRVEVDVNIPNLFANGKDSAPAAPPEPAAPAFSAVAPTAPAKPVAAKKKPAASQAAVAKPADTNYFSKRNGDETEEVAPPVKKGPSPGTAFLARYATPNEIVSKAAALPGVDGALIALPDGLLVANRIPASMNADTIAAFLPQIFGRVSACTKELRLGDLNNLNFTVGAVPWKIFKVGAIYFAVFGRPGEPMPGAQLAGIAGELDRKAK